MASTFKTLSWDDLVRSADRSTTTVNIGPSQSDYAPFVFSNGKRMHTDQTKEYFPEYSIDVETFRRLNGL